MKVKVEGKEQRKIMNAQQKKKQKEKGEPPNRTTKTSDQAQRSQDSRLMVDAVGHLRAGRLGPIGGPVGRA